MYTASKCGVTSLVADNGKTVAQMYATITHIANCRTVFIAIITHSSLRKELAAHNDEVLSYSQRCVSI